MNYRIIVFTLGWVLKIEAVCLLLPLLCSVIYSEPYAWVYAVCALLCMAVGFVFSFKHPKNKSMYAREGFVAVAFSWIVMSVFGALPFVISGYIPNYINALFETVSGFTTTGATILKSDRSHVVL